jgi:hypothetical protein
MRKNAKTMLACSLMTLICSSQAYSQTYEIPPSSSTLGHVPYISDKDMKRCVEIYNEANWLADRLKETTVNQYSQTSVDSYNSKVDQQSRMINYFNDSCAGKQSESAYRAAQELNKR